MEAEILNLQECYTNRLHLDDDYVGHSEGGTSTSCFLRDNELNYSDKKSNLDGLKTTLRRDQCLEEYQLENRILWTNQVERVGEKEVETLNGNGVQVS